MSTIYSDGCVYGFHDWCNTYCDCPCHQISPAEQAAITARLAEVDAMLAEVRDEA